MSSRRERTGLFTCPGCGEHSDEPVCLKMLCFELILHRGHATDPDPDCSLCQAEEQEDYRPRYAVASPFELSELEAESGEMAWR